MDPPKFPVEVVPQPFSDDVAVCRRDRGDKSEVTLYDALKRLFKAEELEQKDHGYKGYDAKKDHCYKHLLPSRLLDEIDNDWTST
jgi:hypothetical protein